MTHLIKSNPTHVWKLDGTKLEGAIPSVKDNVQLLHRLEIPHYLNYQGNILTMIVPFDLPIEPQDTITNEYTFEGLVVDIMERRAARGTWSYEQRPHFVKLKFM